MTERPIEDLDPVVEAYQRLDQGEPPPSVDAAVRSGARTAARRRRASAWTLPAALAATVLIAFSIVLNVQQDKDGAPPPAGRPGNEPAAAAVLQEAAPAAAPPAAPMADAVAEKSAAPAAAPPRAMAQRAVSEEAPEDWLARIEALEAEGRHAEAEAERQRLEAAHPGWLAQHAGERD
jgi:hypothetical protein